MVKDVLIWNKQKLKEDPLFIVIPLIMNGINNDPTLASYLRDMEMHTAIVDNINPKKARPELKILGTKVYNAINQNPKINQEVQKLLEKICSQESLASRSAALQAIHKMGNPALIYAAQHLRNGLTKQALSQLLPLKQQTVLDNPTLYPTLSLIQFT
jgi:hypothetical protein